MSTTTEPQPVAQRLHTIGAVCERLRSEFSDITISKIRYLEDQGLLQPRRTRGGYRLFSEEDIERLQTILRLQRDEFLPLRVIRTELDAHPTTTAKRRSFTCSRSPRHAFNSSCVAGILPALKPPVAEGDTDVIPATRSAAESPSSESGNPG